MPEADVSAAAPWMGPADNLVDINSLVANYRGDSSVALAGPDEVDITIQALRVAPTHKNSQLFADLTFRARCMWHIL